MLTEKRHITVERTALNRLFVLKVVVVLLRARLMHG